MCRTTGAGCEGVRRGSAGARMCRTTGAGCEGVRRGSAGGQEGAGAIIIIVVIIVNREVGLAESTSPASAPPRGVVLCCAHPLRN
eukprot:154148-Prorocentrum_minimum.AAC.2